MLNNKICSRAATGCRAKVNGSCNHDIAVSNLLTHDIIPSGFITCIGLLPALAAQLRFSSIVRGYPQSARLRRAF